MLLCWNLFVLGQIITYNMYCCLDSSLKMLVCWNLFVLGQIIMYLKCYEVLVTIRWWLTWLVFWYWVDIIYTYGLTFFLTCDDNLQWDALVMRWLMMYTCISYLPFNVFDIMNYDIFLLGYNVNLSWYFSFDMVVMNNILVVDMMIDSEQLSKNKLFPSVFHASICWRRIS